MQKKILPVLSIVVIVFLYGCKAGYEATGKNRMKKIYLQHFKMQYFKQMVLAGLNNTNEIIKIFDIDKSFPTELFLSGDDLPLIDSLALADNKIMIQDSINSIGKANTVQGKKVFSYALNKYNSKGLDKMAKKRYKTFYKRELKKHHQ